MEAKWPFMLITFTLIFLLGLMIANVERTSVMNNWATRRCDLPVAFAGAFFKPESDPRTANDFAKDNFEFCMKSYVDKFIALFMGPLTTLFGKQVDATNSASDSINSIRSATQTMYNAFSSYVDSMFAKVKTSAFELNRIMHYLRMATGRISGIAMSMIYSGLSIFRGMINAFQFVIRVVLIICTIMLIIIILLWFILFPVIPLILGTLTAIVSLVFALSMVMSQSLGAEASSSRSGFCFADWVQVAVKQKDGTVQPTYVHAIKIGDELVGGGKVTATIEMDGTDVMLYDLHGIHVSGSHLVKGTDNTWKLVATDERAVKTDKVSRRLYCFNTSTNTVPILSKDGTAIKFRDWEEMNNDDVNGQMVWNYMILTMLNCKDTSTYSKWKNDLFKPAEVGVSGKNVKIKTMFGFVPLSDIRLFDKHVVNRYGHPQQVLGIIHAEVENAQDTDGVWHTSFYELHDNAWIRGSSSVKQGPDMIQGISLITDTGEYIVWDDETQKERIVRDFTEVGHQNIHKTYSFMSDRLCKNQPSTL